MSVHEAALSYVARGWAVLPLAPKKKSPASENGKDDATTDIDTIDRWFSNRALGVGIHAGRSGIVVVDIDPRSGGPAQLAALVQEVGELPNTVTADTPSGGQHYIFRAPHIDEIKYDLRAKFRKGVDFIRGNNYIAASPSLHPDFDGVYHWRAGRGPDEIAIADLPEAWLRLALRERPQPEDRPSPTRSYDGDSVYDVLAQLNQKYVLECVSGTWLVDYEIFTFKKNANGKYNLIVDGKERGNFIDVDGRIGAPDTGRKDGGPLASTWLRWYGHDDKKIRAGLIEFVQELHLFGEKRSKLTPDYHGPADIPHAAEQPVGATPQARPRSLIVSEVAKLKTPPIRSYATGNLQLDTLTKGGINTRELMIVMGPPAAGKTAWAISTAIFIQRTIPVLYASTELEAHELMARIAAHILGVAWSGVRRGTVEQAMIIEALDGIQIYVLGCDSLPRNGDEAILAIEGEALRISKEFGVPPLVVIDYLQDLARGAERDLRSRVGDQASWLRAMSQRLDCPLIGVSSVSRTYYSAKKAAEFRELDDAAAYLAAAKESGDVDYAAARVLFLDAEDDRDKPERDVRIAIAKSRDGRTGFAGARMVGESGRWLFAPEVAEIAAKESTKADRDAEDEEIMLARIRKEINAENKLCTTNELRAGNGISKERAEAALTRLRLARKLRLVDVMRHEAGRQKQRSVFEPIEGAST